MSVFARSLLFSRNIISRVDVKSLDIIRRSNMIRIDKLPPVEEYPKYEATRDKEEWKYVERLIPSQLVPDPPKDVTSTPSGWIPQSADVANAPYYLQRTRNHLLPVYLKIGHRGTHRRTVIKNIHGDIWLMANHLHKYLEYCAQKPVGVRIHEISGIIMVLGDHYSNCEKWLLSKGM